MPAGPTARPGEHARATGGEHPLDEVQVAHRVVAVLGGRYSAGLGIDVDAGEAEVERWFLAATLFGARIPARVAERAFGVLAAAGLARIGQLRHVPSDGLIGIWMRAGTPAMTSVPPLGCSSCARSSMTGTAARSP